ncbi:hypothetical protein JVT61DRAFT_3841 [Boletus reticuloceps]|uniref:Uncharacterized protein n=1 Tax=Boletus reticuloceps TaxID=495285 RepID=A0A8I2YQ76_9AGAM|nr:hypothetical protein JVT61DRAFT_3841 [Boletus reticuloceps]
MQPFGACLRQLYSINIISDPLPSPVSCLPRHISDRPSPPPPLIMSLSVDDLVASLSANHIGQEAIDLAALQVDPISFTPRRFAKELILLATPALPPGPPCANPLDPPAVPLTLSPSRFCLCARG